MNGTCGSCKYWKFGSIVKTGAGLMVRAGLCRLHPPSVLVPVGKQMQIICPQTASTDWCGDYEINLSSEPDMPETVSRK